MNPEQDENTPEALRQLLIRLLTVDGNEEEIEWERLRDFLRLAQKAQRNYNPAEIEYDDDRREVSRQTIDLFFTFLTSKTGLFLKKPLVREISQIIDGMASTGEARMLKISGGIIRPLPGGNGPVNTRRMEELNLFLETLQNAFEGNVSGRARMEALNSIMREAGSILTDEKRRENAKPLLEEVTNVFQMVAVEVLEMRGTRAMRDILRLPSPGTST